MCFICFQIWHEIDPSKVNILKNDILDFWCFSNHFESKQLSSIFYWNRSLSLIDGKNENNLLKNSFLCQFFNTFVSLFKKVRELFVPVWEQIQLLGHVQTIFFCSSCVQSFTSIPLTLTHNKGENCFKEKNGN